MRKIILSFLLIVLASCTSQQSPAKPSSSSPQIILRVEVVLVHPDKSETSNELSLGEFSFGFEPDGQKNFTLGAAQFTLEKGDQVCLRNPSKAYTLTIRGNVLYQGQRVCFGDEEWQTQQKSS